jgi:hypothetical protein
MAFMLDLQTLDVPEYEDSQFGPSDLSVTLCRSSLSWSCG